MDRPYQLPASVQSTSRLLRLADELIISILDQIQDQQTLRNLVLTCQTAQRLAEPYLYRDLIVRDGRQVLRLFSDSIQHAPRRRHYPQHLDVRYKAEGRHNIALLNNLHHRLPNLRSWRIESPCPNDSIAFAFTREFGSGAGEIYYWKNILDLKHLRSLHIHTHVIDASGYADHRFEPSFFDLCGGKASVIFQHPALQRLHLACADITTDSVRLLEDSTTKKTALQYLTFEECNICPNALKLILAQPKALKRLTLGERRHHFHDPTSGYLSEAGAGLGQALALQARSLEYLKQTQRTTRALLHWNSLALSERRHLFSLPSELPDFHELRELDVPHGSSLQNVAAKQPPNLEKMRIHDFTQFARDDAYKALLRECRLLEKTPVRHLEIVLPEARTQREDAEKDWLEILVGPESKKGIWRIDYHRAQVWELGQRLKKNGIRLTMNWIRSAGFIPPYMHGEILPVEFTIYDSNSPSLFGHIPSLNIIRDVKCAEVIKRLNSSGAAAAPSSPGDVLDSNDELEEYMFM